MVSCVCVRACVCVCVCVLGEASTSTFRSMRWSGLAWPCLAWPDSGASDPFQGLRTQDGILQSPPRLALTEAKTASKAQMVERRAAGWRLSRCRYVHTWTTTY